MLLQFLLYCTLMEGELLMIRTSIYQFSHPSFEYASNTSEGVWELGDTLQYVSNSFYVYMLCFILYTGRTEISYMS